MFCIVSYYACEHALSHFLLVERVISCCAPALLLLTSGGFAFAYLSFLISTSAKLQHHLFCPSFGWCFLANIFLRCFLSNCLIILTEPLLLFLTGHCLILSCTADSFLMCCCTCAGQGCPGSYTRCKALQLISRFWVTTAPVTVVACSFFFFSFCTNSNTCWLMTLAYFFPPLRSLILPCLC